VQALQRIGEGTTEEMTLPTWHSAAVFHNPWELCSDQKSLVSDSWNPGSWDNKQSWWSEDIRRQCV